MSEADIAVKVGIESLRSALHDLRKRHSELLRMRTSERTITCHLACLMKRYFESQYQPLEDSQIGWRVDCEYNRILSNGDPKKMLRSLLLRRLQIIKEQKSSKKSSDWNSYLGSFSDNLFLEIEHKIGTAETQNRVPSVGVKSVVPDIIVHTRGYGGLASNALVVEVKPKHASLKSKLFDLVKLSAFTSGVEEENGLVYNKGIFLCLSEQENQSWLFRYGEDEPIVF